MSDLPENHPVTDSRNRNYLILLLWVVLTAINISKAYHIDDTFHLEAALWIREHPAAPMSGNINWQDYPTPLYTHNQPPLFFYLLALAISLLGTGETALHLFMSAFTLLALLLFRKLTDRLRLKNGSLLLVLFALNPALVVNQNLMTDVPLLVMVLAAALFLVRAEGDSKGFGYGLSALFMGIGLLIKYSVLPLLVVLTLVIIIRREYKYLVVLLIPLGMLSLWSVWNFMEYGSVHFLDRPRSGLHINRLWSFLAATGSMAFFSAAMVYGCLKRPFVRTGIFALISLFLLLVIAFAAGFVPESGLSDLFNVLFVLNGLIVFTVLIRKFLTESRKNGLQQYISTGAFIIFLFAAALASFMILFAPFMATRHILLILPFILPFSSGIFENSGKAINRLSLAATVFMGLMLGVSDYTYAGYYRRMAEKSAALQPTGVWTAGHWGWQWYTTSYGLKQYETGTPEVRPGDVFIYPANIPRQDFSKNLTLEITGKYYEEFCPLTFFSGNNFGSLYSSSMKIAPWSLTLKPIDTIYICRVTANNARNSD
ncbi:Dolichyl-phosphate-mannose-protein mannosyltransferase [anaerobic digester metagenome]